MEIKIIDLMSVSRFSSYPSHPRPHGLSDWDSFITPIIEGGYKKEKAGMRYD